MIFAVESSAQTCAEGRIIRSPVFVYDASADSMRITVPVKNVGDAEFVPPFKITVYKNDIGNEKLYTYNYNDAIEAGETVNIAFGIPDFKAEWTPFDGIKIRINDGGDGFSNQLMCDSAFRDYTRTQLIASDDYMLVFNASEDNQFRVAINDILPVSYVSLTVNLLSNPVYSGEAYVSGSAIYHWYNAETGGSVVANGNPGNTLTIVKDASAADIGTWWVEPRYGNFVFRRHRVDLKLGDNCGVTDPQGCAVTGTVIWKEDFGGNSTGAPQRAPDPGWKTSGKTTYNYVTRTEWLLPGINEYGLLKNIQGYTTMGWAHSYLDDHTSWGDQNSGYFLTFDASSSPGEFYNFDIDELCAGKELSFSAWLMNINPPAYALYPPSDYSLPNVQFVIEDTGGIVLSRFNTGDVVVTTTGPVWVNYSFNFTVPTGINQLKVKFVNNITQSGYSGNDISIDDIEVRLCAPPVTMDIPGNDTVVCSGNPLDITGTYTEDCTFGNNLAYRWQFRHADSSSRKTLEQDNVTVNCSSANPADRTIIKTRSIISATKADEGYYRMLWSSEANIGSINCRAASDSVYVRIIDWNFVAPDIRLQLCSSPPNRMIQLTGYLDSTDYDRVQWKQVSAYPVISNAETGLITDSYFHENGVYTYQYTLLSPEYSGCGSTSARVYIRAQSNRIFGRLVDTITICSALSVSRSVNLNRIFGLELGGVWSYPNDPDGIAQNNVTKFVSPSKYAGAMVFNAQKAYAEADDSYNIMYKGAPAKKFDFVYTASCVAAVKRVTLIVTAE
jgi:hypothetical protein